MLRRLCWTGSRIGMTSESGKYCRRTLRLNVPADDGMMPIYWAADRESLPTIKCMVEHGADKIKLSGFKVF